MKTLGTNFSGFILGLLFATVLFSIFISHDRITRAEMEARFSEFNVRMNLLEAFVEPLKPKNVPNLKGARAVRYYKDGVAFGMRIYGIFTGAILEKRGLKSGDIIVSVDGKKISDGIAFISAIESIEVETENPEVTVMRDGKEVHLATQASLGTVN